MLPATEYETVKFWGVLLWNARLEPVKLIESNWEPSPKWRTDIAVFWPGTVNGSGMNEAVSFADWVRLNGCNTTTSTGLLDA